MIGEKVPAADSKPAWVSIADVAAELNLPIETVRMSAVVDLNLDLYDPEQDSVSETGRNQLRDYLRDAPDRH